MTMTPRELEQSGRLIYGERWQTALARGLGVADRTVRRWFAGAVPIPGPAAIAIRALVENARHRREEAPR
jgi:DNA-binding transcriptional regulator YdaS (Cro superfamily)